MSSYYFNPDEVRRLTELREAIMLSVKKEIAQGFVLDIDTTSVTVTTIILTARYWKWGTKHRKALLCIAQ